MINYLKVGETLIDIMVCAELNSLQANYMHEGQPNEYAKRVIRQKLQKAVEDIRKWCDEIEKTMEGSDE